MNAAEEIMMKDLDDTTTELPAEAIRAAIEECRRRALINAGLMRPVGELTDGALTRRQAS